jgi:iron complex transport system ATP-binding protein
VILDADRLEVRYAGAGRRALDGVSCRVGPGELVAIAGPNGSGKTTLVRAVTGLVPLAAGGVRIQGRPLGEWRRPELARVLGVVPQREDIVFPLRVDETVMLGRYARLGALGAPAAADREAVRSALARCDAEALAARSADTLSGGEWQRVRIARALAQEPRGLVLDEPTASLDVRHEMELFELVSGLVRRDGLAALIVSHHLNAAARFADRLILMARGRIVTDDVPAKVLDPAVLTRVFGWPVAVQTLPDGTPQLFPLRPSASGEPT